MLNTHLFNQHVFFELLLCAGHPTGYWIPEMKRQTWLLPKWHLQSSKNKIQFIVLILRRIWNYCFRTKLSCSLLTCGLSYFSPLIIKKQSLCGPEVYSWYPGHAVEYTTLYNVSLFAFVISSRKGALPPLYTLRESQKNQQKKKQTNKQTIRNSKDPGETPAYSLCCKVLI